MRQGERRWRAIADLSAYELLRCGKAARTPSRDDVHAILRIWNTRLGCLCRLRHLGNLTSESTALFALLPPPYLTPLEPYSHVPAVDDAERPQHFDPLMPFELVLTWAMLSSPTQADDLTALRRLGEVQEGCKREFWRTSEAVWTERMRKASLLRVNLLVQMREYTQAARILDQLVHTSNGPDNKRYLEAAFLLYTEMGDLLKAGQMKDRLSALGPSAGEEEAGFDSTIDLDTIGHLSQNRWEEAEASARKAMKLDPDDIARRNTVAVCCMYTGKITEVRFIEPCLSLAIRLTQTIPRTGHRAARGGESPGTSQILQRGVVCIKLDHTAGAPGWRPIRQQARPAPRKQQVCE